MPLTMRPIGGHSPVYQDRQDWTILDEGQPVGRIYEDTSASTIPCAVPINGRKWPYCKFRRGHAYAPGSAAASEPTGLLG